MHGSQAVCYKYMPCVTETAVADSALIFKRPQAMLSIMSLQSDVVLLLLLFLLVLIPRSPRIQHTPLSLRRAVLARPTFVATTSTVGKGTRSYALYPRSQYTYYCICCVHLQRPDRKHATMLERYLYTINNFALFAILFIVNIMLWVFGVMHIYLLRLRTLAI